jgi:hypothetical protein
MENRYDNRDFEHFVKQNADQYRMFPSEKVWKNIHHNLHHRNRWYGIGLTLLLLTTASVTWVMLIPSNRNQQLANRLPEVSARIQISDQKVQSSDYITPVKPKQGSGQQAVQYQNLFMADISDQPETDQSAVAEELAPAAISKANLLTVSPTIQATALKLPAASLPIVSARVSVHMKPVQERPELPLFTTMIYDEVKPVDEPAAASNVAISETGIREEFPMTIESVTNSYIQTKKKNKFSLQAYFTPTVSYRRLKEENQFISEVQSRTIPTNSTVTIEDVNKIVTHKPDFGLQLGINAGYSLSPRFTLISGLQFNVSKYDIRAYNYPSEPASIALMAGSPSASVQTEATYRNYSGSKNPDWLHNLYFSASIPIGLQYRLSGAGKPEIGISGTVQPTYMLGNRTYLLTTDYNNYVEAPSLIRRWNMSTSLEVFAGISSGRIDWKIGPQVRYQLLSSFKREYPVKEHLFDFGLKVGIMLNK